MEGEDQSRQFDLAERTARFGESVINHAKQIPFSAITKDLITQFVDAGTSIGANYCEADDAGTRKEFRYRISLCKRESRETMYWLRMIATAVPDLKEQGRILWKEADELNRIFAAIYRNTTPDE